MSRETLALVRVALGSVRPLDFLKTKLQSSLSAICDEVQMSVWQNNVRVEILTIPSNKFGQDVRVLIDDKPRSRRDRSFFYKLLVKRHNLRLLFQNSHILVFLALTGRIQDLMIKYAGWESFLRAVHRVVFGVFVIGDNEILYYGMPPSACLVSGPKVEYEWMPSGSLTNSVAEVVLSSIGEICHV